MLWREDLRLIYVLQPDNTWFSTGDRWREGDMPFNPDIEAPNGLYQPVQGFGLVWREQPGVRTALGWGLTEETGFNARLQRFVAGELWLDSQADNVFVLFNDGTYQIR